MGTIIIILAAILEVVFAAYCIRTKSSQNKVRSIGIISAFGVFILFSVLSVLQWGGRWYLLALLLFVGAVIGAASLIRKKEDKKPYKTYKIVIRGVAFWTAVIVASIPALVFPQYKLPIVTGKYKVNTKTYTYTDNSLVETFTNTGENRKVTVEFWYPENVEGKLPLVVFSHGSFGVVKSNTSTFMDLASNGYIVCSIGHPYHSLYNKDAEGKVTIVNQPFVKEISDVNAGVYDDKTTNELEHQWMKVRTDDMNLVFNTLINMAKDSSSDKIYKLIDTDKIGVFGHSLGGAASAQLGRDRKDIDAVVNLDGDFLGEWLEVIDGKPVVNDKPYPVPMLSIYTDAMKQAFDSAKTKGIVTPRDKMSTNSLYFYEVFFSGTNHMSVTDLPLVSPILVQLIGGSIKKSGTGHAADEYEVIKKMNSIILEFFNCYLKGQGSFNSAGTY
jgi:dienelactone hydrolase